MSQSTELFLWKTSLQSRYLLGSEEESKSEVFLPPAARRLPPASKATPSRATGSNHRAVGVGRLLFPRFPDTQVD